MTVKDIVLPSVLRVKTEQEREATQQLMQANDTVARLQDELSDFRQRSAPLWEEEMKGRDSKIFKPRNTFCGTWYLPHSHVHNERTVSIIMDGCMAHEREFYISTSGL